MKKILKVLLHPVLLAIVGLIALSLLIWFVGPLIAIADWRPLEPEWLRLALILLAFGIYFGRKLWAVIKAKRLNTRLMDGLLRASKAEEQPGVGAEEVAVLRKRFEEALGVLRHSRLGREQKRGALAALAGRQYLYQLPWYIFIGAPGSGKTTALINSGLQFPLADKFGSSSIRGIGGTRNCDWWFTDEAVLLDTAGRYTTQESHHEADRAAWDGFLQLLKKFRPRRPINGILLTVSVSDLLQQNAAERDSHAAAVRTRIQELHERLNIRFPIYVLVTKCDLLAGFMEFFGEFGKEERAQVWGMSFPFQEADAGSALGNFKAEFAALRQRLHERLIDRLQQEREPGRRTLLYGFPQQFSTIEHLLGGFLESVFAPTAFREKPMLRGIYFTSGTQEGNPIDRVIGTLARGLGIERKILPAQIASGRSYFLTRLLREVVFPEQGLAGTNLRWERRRALLQWGGYALVGLFAVAAASAWVVSYQRNQAYVAEVGGKLEQIRKKVESLPADASTDAVGLLPILQAVREIAATAEVRDGEIPLAMGFGLFQGDKLAAASATTYRRLLQDTFLQRISYRIEEQMRTAGGNLELLYEALKAYIMLHDAGRFEAEPFKAWISVDWERNLPREVGVEQRQQLEAHLAALFQRGHVSPPLPADAQLIQQVRATLAQYPLPQRVYSRLKRQGVGAEIPEFKVTQVAGPAASLVFERASGAPLTQGVPGLFTYDGYHKAFVKEAERVTAQLADEETWVLGVTDGDRLGRFSDPRALARLTEDVRRLYLHDYAQTWEKFVNDVRLARAGSLQQSIQQARILSASDSPLPLLIRAMARETTLGDKAAQDKTALDKAADTVKDTRERLLKILPGAQQPGAATAAAARLESIVDDRFIGLRQLVTVAPGSNQPAPIDATLALINEVYTLLSAADTAIKAKAAPPQSEVPNKVKAEAARMPEPLRSMLQTLSASGAAQALGATRSNLSEGIASGIGDFCHKAIAGRYPFVRNSGRDVTQEDFGRLFAPGGLIDDFFQKNLAPFVDTSSRPWSFRQFGEATMGRGSGGLVQFQRAAVIRDVFFRAGGRTPALRLEFKPLEMDAGITQFILDVDGQLVRYSHGPQVPTSVQWPGPRGSTQVRLQLTPPSPGGASGSVFEGPWALFRMLDRANIEETAQAERFKVTFNIDGRKAQFEVIASSVQNPFRLRELEQFQCPTGL